MDPTAIMGAAGDAGETLATLVSELRNQGRYDEADRLQRQLLEEYGAIDIPNAADIKAQVLQSQASTAQGSEEAKAARLEALRGLRQRASEGYTAEDRAAINDIMGEVGAADRGRREAVMRSMDPNSGAAVAARLSSAQGASQMANRRGLDVAGQSRRAALQAIAQGGQLAGDIDESEFGQSFRRGGAADAIAQANERNRLGALEGNRDYGMRRFGAQMAKQGARADVTRGIQENIKSKAKRKTGTAAAIGGISPLAGLAYGFFG